MTLRRLYTFIPSLSSLNRWIIVIAVGLVVSVFQEQVAAAQVNKDATPAKSGRSIAAYDEAIRRYEAAELREKLAEALYSKGIVLAQSGRKEEAIAILDDVVRRFGTASEPQLREMVATALGSKGDILDDLGRYE